MSAFNAFVCDINAWKGCLSITKAESMLNAQLSAVTNLKSLQVAGKLRLFGFLHVQLLHQLFWALAVFPSLGLFLWGLLGWSRQNLQCSVQHVELWGRNGQGLISLWPWEHIEKRGWRREKEETRDLKSREKSSLIKL